MVLITGTNSLLGKALVEKFIQSGEKIRCYDQYKPESIPDGVEFMQGDLFTMKRLNLACKDVDTIIHLMDKNSPKKTGRKKMKKINVSGTKNLLNAAKKMKIKRFIFLSTYAIYGKTKSFPLKEDDRKKPYTAYGKDKLKAEIICESFAKKNKIDLSVLRPSVIAGPEVKNSSILITLYMAMGLGNDNVMFISGDGDTRFQLLSPEDAASAFYSVYKAGEKTHGMTFNVGSDNVPTQMEQIVKIKERKKLDFAVKHISKMKALFYSILSRTSKVSYFTREHFMYIFHTVYLDSHRLKTVTGWSPKKDNLDIMSETVDWYKNKVE